MSLLLKTLWCTLWLFIVHTMVCIIRLNHQICFVLYQTYHEPIWWSRYEMGSNHLVPILTHQTALNQGILSNSAQKAPGLDLINTSASIIEDSSTRYALVWYRTIPFIYWDAIGYWDCDPWFIHISRQHSSPLTT